MGVSSADSHFRLLPAVSFQVVLEIEIQFSSRFIESLTSEESPVFGGSSQRHATIPIRARDAAGR